VDNGQRMNVRTYPPIEVRKIEIDEPLLVNRPYLLSSVDGLARITFLQSFLRSGCLLASYNHLQISILMMTIGKAI
jgi:hypothetical protein